MMRQSWERGFKGMAARAEDVHGNLLLRVLWQARQDVHYALRQLRLAPVFTLTVVLTLGLGIGATTAIFSLIHVVMLRSLPVVDPERLYRIGAEKTCCATGALQGDWERFSYSLYKRVEQSAPQFDNIAAFQGNAGVLSVRDSANNAQARPLLGEYVSGNYFQTFGLKAFAGRLFTREDDRGGAPPVAVLSHRAWLQEYRGSDSVIGSTVIIETYPFTIIGVAPPGFFGETLSSTPTEIWVPLETEYLIDGKAAFNLVPSQAWLHLIGHLKPGSTTDGVPAELTAVLQHWLIAEAALPAQNRPQSQEDLARQTIQLAPGGSGVGTMRDTYAGSLRLLFGLCLAVLLIACANVANVLLARGMARRGHIALQLALGASRRRILQQALTETSVIALFGGLLGIAIAWFGAKMVLRLAFRHAASMSIDVQPSLPVLGFCLGVSLLTGLLFGAIPAWLASCTDPIESLRGASRATQNGASVPQKLLIVLQAALSVVLIALAGMLTHSIQNLQKQDLGFATSGRISVQMEPPLADYTLERLTLKYRELQDRLSEIPGVRSASLGLNGPVERGWKETMVLPGEGMPRLDGTQSASWNRVSQDYFTTIGLPVLEGRPILASDTAKTRGVAVVNQAFAKRFFPNQQVIGKHFGIGLPAYSNALEIVGMVRDARSGDLRLPPQPMAYGALTQHIAFAEETLLASDKWDHFINDVQLSVSGSLGEMEPSIREAFRLVDPNFTIIRIEPLQELVDTQFDQQDAVAKLSSLFGLLALTLAVVGLYGVSAYTVARRTSEIGVRVALGASRQDIIGLVLRGAFLQVAVGLALGMPIAVGLAKMMSTNLYQVGLLDWPALATAAGMLALGACVASVFPARRAAGIDPVRALRAE